MSDKTPSEIELKIDLVNEANYRRLIDYLEIDMEPAVQSNYFFDTDRGDLGEKRWALRLRIENGKAILTLKGNRRESSKGLAVRTEIESEIPSELKDEFLEKRKFSIMRLPVRIREVLPEFPDDTIFKLKLGFTNHRIKTPFRSGENEYLLEIDRTRFPNDFVDYELEVEIAEEAGYTDTLRAVTALLAKSDIPLIFQPKSKLKRALENRR